MSRAGVSDALIEGFSGALGSVVALLATYPLKTIYTLQALSTGQQKIVSTTNDDAGARLLAVLRFLTTYKLSNLYAGLGPNVVESALSSGVYFFFYSKLREQAVLWSRRHSRSSTLHESTRSRDVGVLASLLVATAAGACNQLITLPASVVATRMQGYRSLSDAGTSKRPPTSWETIASVYREGGLAGFWKGLLPSMILLANPAVQYMLFEKIKTLFRYWKEQRMLAAAWQRAAAAAATTAAAAAAAAAAETLGRRHSAKDSGDAMEEQQQGPAAAGGQQPGKDAAAVSGAGAGAGMRVVPFPSAVQLSALEVFLAGALAKIGATVVTYPMIVIKARLQASSSTPSAASSGPAAAGSGSLGSSTWGVISATARHEGMGGFFKGLRAKILQTALNAALMLMLKEQLHGATRSVLCLAAPAAVQEAAAKAAAAVATSPA